MSDFSEQRTGDQKELSVVLWEHEGFESRIVELDGEWLWLWKCRWHREFRVYRYGTLGEAMRMHEQFIK